MTIRVCDECAQGIQTDDWTHHEEDEEVMGTVSWFLETYKDLTIIGENNDGGYYQCPCCWCDALGGVEFEIG